MRFKLVFGSVLAQFSLPIANVLLSIIIVRVISPEFWGNYVQHLIIVNLFLTIINWGSKDYLSKKYSESPQNIPYLLNTSIQAKIYLVIPVLILLIFLPLPNLYRTLILLWIPIRMSAQFFDALNIYRRFFGQMAILEAFIVSILIIGLLVFHLSFFEFMLLIIFTDLIKAIVFYCFYKAFSPIIWRRYAIQSYLKESFLFFLLTISSLLASRADLYIFSYFKDNSTLAQYQILVNFIQYAHLFATALVLPFIKNLFRINFNTLNRLERQFMGFGLFAALILTLGIFFISKYLYKFELENRIYFLVYFNILTFYFYFLQIVTNYRINKVQRVLYIMSVMGATNVFIGVLFIPKLGLIGGLLASLAAGVVGVVGFRLFSPINFTFKR